MGASWHVNAGGATKRSVEGETTGRREIFGFAMIIAKSELFTYNVYFD
jgi:hypothetical protein